MNRENRYNTVTSNERYNPRHTVHRSRSRSPVRDRDRYSSSRHRRSKSKSRSRSRERDRYSSRYEKESEVEKLNLEIEIARKKKELADIQSSYEIPTISSSINISELIRSAINFGEKKAPLLSSPVGIPPLPVPPAPSLVISRSYDNNNDNQRNITVVKANTSVENNKVCRNYNKCYNMICEFRHSPGYIPQPVVRCKFGGDCRSRECFYSHPSDKYWTKLPDYNPRY
jgi:hypothetical protein